MARRGALGGGASVTTAPREWLRPTTPARCCQWDERSASRWRSARSADDQRKTSLIRWARQSVKKCWTSEAQAAGGAAGGIPRLRTPSPARTGQRRTARASVVSPRVIRQNCCQPTEVERISSWNARGPGLEGAQAASRRRPSRAAAPPTGRRGVALDRSPTVLPPRLRRPAHRSGWRTRCPRGSTARAARRRRRRAAPGPGRAARSGVRQRVRWPESWTTRRPSRPDPAHEVAEVAAGGLGPRRARRSRPRSGCRPWGTPRRTTPGSAPSRGAPGPPTPRACAPASSSSSRPRSTRDRRTPTSLASRLEVPSAAMTHPGAQRTFVGLDDVARTTDTDAAGHPHLGAGRGRLGRAATRRARPG